MVECKDCVHFRRVPGGSPWKKKTGCYHPDLMVQKQSERFLAEQQVPGDHEKINLLGDCAKFEAKPSGPPLLERVLVLLKS